MHTMNLTLFVNRISFRNRPISSVGTPKLSMREIWGSIRRPVESAQCRQRLATAATVLRSCVAQALSRGDGHRHSSHTRFGVIP